MNFAAVCAVMLDKIEHDDIDDPDSAGHHPVVAWRLTLPAATR
jgi:hypothetical protein